MAVVQNIFSSELCRELILIQRICGVPGYRPKYTSTLLACAPPWSFHALIIAREIVRSQAEEQFDLCLDLHFETTALSCWFPGAELGSHADNCKEYLAHRDISAAVWLNDGFEGGEFFFSDAPPVQMAKGSGAIYRASTLHGVKLVTKGERFSLLVWMTKKSEEVEDPKVISGFRSVNLGPASERLFGQGPQTRWPNESHVDRQLLVGFTGKTLAQLEDEYMDQIAEFQLWFPVERWRVAVALAAFADYSGSLNPVGLAHGLANFIRQRELEFDAHRSNWDHQGFLSMSAELSFLHYSDCMQVGVPGLARIPNVLDEQQQNELWEILLHMVGNFNQSMRFGILPTWAAELAAKLGIEANQLIVNGYMPGQGIVRHVDLLRFGDRICGVSLGAPACMIFRQLSDDACLYSGNECKLQDDHFTGRCVELPLLPGEAYCIQGHARYQWTHEIPGESVTGKRLSVTLRSMLTSSSELTEPA